MTSIHHESEGNAAYAIQEPSQDHAAHPSNLLALIEAHDQRLKKLETAFEGVEAALEKLATARSVWVHSPDDRRGRKPLTEEQCAGALGISTFAFHNRIDTIPGHFMEGVHSFVDATIFRANFDRLRAEYKASIRRS